MQKMLRREPRNWSDAASARVYFSSLLALLCHKTGCAFYCCTGREAGERRACAAQPATPRAPRIEGRLPVLAVMRFGGDALSVVTRCWSCSFRSAACSADRGRLAPGAGCRHYPRHLRYSWLDFVMASPAHTMQMICIVAPGFSDTSERRMYPRRVCFNSWWGGLAVFIKAGLFHLECPCGFWI